MSEQKRTYKRKTYFVKKDFQTRFILKFSLITLVGVGISTILLFTLCRDTLTSTFRGSKLVIENTCTAILPNVILSNLITLALITLAAIAVTLFVSHKIAGPLFRLEKEVKEIGAGDLTKKVTFREKDQITALADGLTLMTASLNSKVLEVRTGLERLIESAFETNAPQELIDDLNKLHTKINDNFKI